MVVEGEGICRIIIVLLGMLLLKITDEETDRYRTDRCIGSPDWTNQSMMGR